MQGLGVRALVFRGLGALGFRDLGAQACSITLQPLVAHVPSKTDKTL